ncbi:MAG: DM13 domain-containing protein [Nocardioides sp.]
MWKWIAAPVAVAVVAAGLWFEPWRLVTSSEIDEPLPGLTGQVVAAPAPSAEPSASDEANQQAGQRPRQQPQKKTQRPPAEPSQAPSESKEAPSPAPTQEPAEEPAEEAVPEIVELAAGDFETAEHETSGRARILELADGSRYVRFEDLATSDGPDLDVWITDQPSGGSWGSYDDGRSVRLGDLKATNGDQNYEIPKDANLDGMTSVVIWCVRFDVAFGTAPVNL